MELTQQISQFLAYLEKEKRYSEHTIKAYQFDLKEFDQFLLFHFSITHIAEVKREQIRSFIVELVDLYAPKSIQRKFSALKSLFKYALQIGTIDKDPTKGIIIPKIPKRQPVFLSHEELEKAKLYFSGGPQNSDFNSTLAHLSIELLYQTGIRANEAINLSLKNIDLYNAQIKVLGKRSKERIIPISNQLLELIKLFINFKHELSSREFLLCDETGAQLSYQKFYKLVKQQLNTLSTKSKLSPHVLRHTFATHMLNNGAEITGLKDLLGHSSLGSTQVYTHNSFEKLKKVYNASHSRKKK